MGYGHAKDADAKAMQRWATTEPSIVDASTVIEFDDDAIDTLWALIETHQKDPTRAHHQTITVEGVEYVLTITDA